MRSTGISAVPKQLIRYRKRIRTEGQQLKAEQSAVHFFADDRDFEVTWSTPNKPLNYLSKFKAVLTPDFSLYRDWPMTMQLWNVYRNRWVGCFWQDQGYTVIPTISWSNQASWEFAFEGIVSGSLVAVSSVGIDRHDATEVSLFLDGYAEMLNRLNPCAVMYCGSDIEGCTEWVETHCYPTLWDDARTSMTQTVAS